MQTKSKSSRKLAVIMFTDIVGYTALMGSDEIKALEILRGSRAIHKKAIDKFNGKWLKEMGDGVLARFKSALDAVHCAHEIQRQSNHLLEAKIRIGLHLGDVSIEDGDVFGDGVNIASRLQALADPGGIYVSEAIINAIRGIRDIEYTYIGPLVLKNVSEPVNTYYLRKEYLPEPERKKIRALTLDGSRQYKRYLPATLVLLILIAITIYSIHQFKKSEIRSIAVIPFENMSNDATEVYFVNGMTNTLIANLGKISALRVIWNKSVSQLEHSGMSFSDIGEQLGVDALIFGSVSKEENRVRINAQMVNTRNEELIWSESYDRDLTSTLELQSEIAKSIIREIEVLITSEEMKQLSSASKVDPEGLEMIFKGFSHLYMINPEHYEIALDYFTRALDYEYLNAQAYAGIAMVWVHRGQWGRMDPVVAGIKAKQAAEKALELDDNLPLAHLAMAHVYTSFEWNWEKAAGEFEHTIRLNNSLPEPRAFYADLLVSLRQFDEAIHQIEIAIQLDPLNPVMHMLKGWVFMAVRRYDEAIKALNRSLELQPGMALSHRCLWTIYHQRGDYDKAIFYAANFYKYQDLAETASHLTQEFKRIGYINALNYAADHLADKYSNVTVSGMRIARFYTFTGNKNKALFWLEKAYEEHYVSFFSLNVDPHWESLHKEERFLNLVNKMNLVIPESFPENPE